MGGQWKLDEPLDAAPFIDWLDSLARRLRDDPTNWVLTTGAGDRAHRAKVRRASGEIRGVRCAGVRSTYPRKGSRCSRPALKGGEFCRYHDPALRGEVVATVTAAREKTAA